MKLFCGNAAVKTENYICLALIVARFRGIFCDFSRNTCLAIFADIIGSEVNFGK